MKKLLPFLLFLIFSCDSNIIDPNESESGRQLNAFNVKLRVQNNTAFTLEQISSNNSSFGNLSSTNYSDYLGFSIIHTYPEITAVVSGKQVRYLGSITNDPMHEKGWFTIKVSDIDTSLNMITATLIKDSN